jgi:hypothetical protein
VIQEENEDIWKKKPLDENAYWIRIVRTKKPPDIPDQWRKLFKEEEDDLKKEKRKYTIAQLLIQITNNKKG